MIDKKKDPNADTGLFDLIYKQNYPRTPPYLGMNLSVRGRKIFRGRARATKVESKVRFCFQQVQEIFHQMCLGAT